MAGEWRMWPRTRLRHAPSASITLSTLSSNPGRLSLLNVDSVGALFPLLEAFNLLPPALSRDAVLSDPEFDRINEVGEGSPAEQEDVFRGGEHSRCWLPWIR